MAELREFMFSSVYLNSIAKVEEGKAQDMLRQLFDYYLAHFDELPEHYRDIWARQGPETAERDYIAGMTDAYATELFQDLFIPKSWTVK